MKIDGMKVACQDYYDPIIESRESAIIGTFMYIPAIAR
jgi:hypothetical protein